MFQQILLTARCKYAEGRMFDVATTLTTQGDILYRDGSGLARLGAGTSGQALLTGEAGANQVGNVSSKILRGYNHTVSSNISTNSNSYQDTDLLHSHRQVLQMIF